MTEHSEWASHSRSQLCSALDLAGFAVIVQAYLSDGSTILLALRSIVHTQLSCPLQSHPDRSLRFFMTALLVSSAAVLVYHATQALSTTTSKSVLIDFVGIDATPSRLIVLAWDCVLVAMQIALLVTSYEDGRSTATSSYLAFASYARFAQPAAATAASPVILQSSATEDPETASVTEEASSEDDMNIADMDVHAYKSTGRHQSKRDPFRRNIVHLDLRAVLDKTLSVQTTAASLNYLNGALSSFGAQLRSRRLQRRGRTGAREARLDDASDEERLIDRYAALEHAHIPSDGVRYPPVPPSF
ncbi:uncharacterized protein L969DRAFT_104471 [Mixia osmundae IAM 14324]|uniref:DUF1746 domain-containing protein n=1 Tax=Mixia osmundae (strain CBS 9802 / IAM 14324 / JCM 22182 / KY 12970) TaxID=764103 RepID=G7EAC5_MIXOS|nr:uncharacterized protein L969DRAFT_104471 [Mixia osmundae IAM 14324]KEI37843.1 hypothetical protein L969DRAFT_104471 [Mixia osmundae IAM 14324]GAA99785.1 hypothetical protein E5Q_06488 [Mixia osmundae IAM 14324]